MTNTPPSILAIDDEPNNFDVIQILLGDRGYIFHYASSGQRALDRLLAVSSSSEQRFQPDLILLDVMMPDLDGIEVCRRIKAVPQLQSIPIIMVTALTDKANLEKIMSTGADDFIAKPIHRVEILARVASRLRTKQQYEKLHLAHQQLQLVAETRARTLEIVSNRVLAPVRELMNVRQLLAATELTPEQQNFTNIVRVNGEILLTVVADLLEVAKIDANDLDRVGTISAPILPS